jgi:hypothetical protein
MSSKPDDKRDDIGWGGQSGGEYPSTTTCGCAAQLTAARTSARLRLRPL